jgi:hypothetical protein
MTVKHHCFGEIPIGELGQLQTNGKWIPAKKPLSWVIFRRTSTTHPKGRVEELREKARSYYRIHADKFTEYQRKHREERKRNPKLPSWKHIPPKPEPKTPYISTYTQDHKKALEQLKCRIIETCSP